MLLSFPILDISWRMSDRSGLVRTRSGSNVFSGRYLEATVWCPVDYWARNRWPASACTRQSTCGRHGSRPTSNCFSSPAAWLSAASCRARCAPVTWCRVFDTSSASRRLRSRQRPASSRPAAGSTVACWRRCLEKHFVLRCESMHVTSSWMIKNHPYTSPLFDVHR